MEQHGDAATETTSVLSTKLLRTALCQRRRALHHCGNTDRFQTTGLTFVGSLNFLNQIGIGKYDFIEPDRRILLEERPTACPYGQQKKAYQ